MKLVGELIHVPTRHSGSSAIEFLVVMPVLIILMLGLLQTAFLYRANTILTYATLEAARVGATENAQFEPMMSTLIMRLMPLVTTKPPLQGAQNPILPDGADLAQLRNRTRLERLSPDEKTFEDWGRPIGDSGSEIPNSHLLMRAASDTIGIASGLNLAEANLLKIKTVYGVELKVPLVGSMITSFLLHSNPSQAAYYLRGQLPLSSTATVRMQSRSFRRWDSAAVIGGPNLVSPPDSGGLDADVCLPGQLEPTAVSAALAGVTSELTSIDECGFTFNLINDLYAFLDNNTEQLSIDCDVVDSA